ncbi:MAG TPA: HAD family hydrolase [Mycobacteriales bacterium]|nr:HAD family hydrolase [Mycobacteriales bacterium]
MDLQAIVFDFDGTIIDSEGTFLQSWVEEFELYGAPWDPAAWLAAVGSYVPDWDPHAELARIVGPGYDRPESERRRRARELALVMATEPRPGVLDHLRAARAAGVPLGVATTSGADWVGGHLDRLGLSDYFTAVVSREDVRRVKPDPEPYRLACERLGAEPKAAVAIEDSRNGVLSATAAGLYCLAVANPITTLQDLSPADRRLESLAELDFAELAELPFR